MPDDLHGAGLPVGPTDRPGERVDVVVVGGGPAGLTAALVAARAGHDVRLVEAADRLGGLARSITIAGQRVDLGSHRLHPSAAPRVRRLLDEVLGGDLQQRERRGRMRLADRWVGFPLRVGDLARQLPPALAAAIAWDQATASRRVEPLDGSYADVVAARLGPTVLRTFHGPYARKLWGVDPVELDGDLARRRIALKGPGDVVRRLTRAGRPQGRTFLYPRLGYGQIVEGLAAAAAAAGVRISTGRRPTAVAPGDPAVVLLDDGTHLISRRVLWTAPPGPLAAAVGATPVPLAHRAVLLVYLVLDTDVYTPWDAHYVADPEVPFVRLSEPKNYRDGPDPEGRTVLCAEWPCTEGDEIWTATEQWLARRVLDGMGRLGLPMAPLSGSEVVRLPRVYPLLRRDDAEGVREAIAHLERLPGVTLLGRQGLAVTDNLHHVIEMGMDAAAALGPEGTWDAAAWTRGRARFDDHVVED